MIYWNRYGLKVRHGQFSYTFIQMRILIAGGLGFVGGRLAQQLHKAGHQVLLGSRRVSCPPNWLPQAEMALTEWDNRLSLEKICSGVDVVIQSAGMNAQDCAANPLAALEMNGLATARLLSAAIRSGVQRFIYLSTAHVYCNPLEGLISEETPPTNSHPYATSHLAGENVVLEANQRVEIEGVVLRLSNVFGYPAHKDVNCWMLLVNDLCEQVARTRKLVLRSNGLQKRDFVAMADVCSAIEHLSACNIKLLNSNLINIGSGKSQSVLEITQLIQQRSLLLFGYKPEIEFPVVSKSEICTNLEFSTAKMVELGLSMNNSNLLEIDKLLTFCEALFNKISMAKT